MIWTQSQAATFATVSRVFVCSLGNSFDRMTEYVQNVRSLRSHVASEQVDCVWLKVPKDGDRGARRVRHSRLCSATCRRSESVRERSHPGAL